MTKTQGRQDGPNSCHGPFPPPPHRTIGSRHDMGADPYGTIAHLLSTAHSEISRAMLRDQLFAVEEFFLFQHHTHQVKAPFDGCFTGKYRQLYSVESLFLMPTKCSLSGHPAGCFQTQICARFSRGCPRLFSLKKMWKPRPLSVA